MQLAASQLRALAYRLDLDFVEALSPQGWPEQYLYSADMRYRYAFARWWGEQTLESATVWVGLNPGTGDTDAKPRPTLGRCIRWSQGWGSTGLLIVNLFAYRDTNPKALRATSDPVGPDNDEVVKTLTGVGQRTVVAWGAHGRLNGRSSEIALVLADPECLGVTRTGEPRHPLYVPGDAEPHPWTPPNGSTRPL